MENKPSGPFWVGSNWTMEQVIDYLMVHLGGDEHHAMMMVVEQLRAETARAEKTERDAAARYDCKGGPGTTTPACGGCVTCLHRVIEKAEAQADPIVMQAASFAVHGALGWGFDPNTVSPASLARAAESLAQEFMTMRARAEKAELDYRGVVENFDLDSLNKAINDARARVAELEAQNAEISTEARNLAYALEAADERQAEADKKLLDVHDSLHRECNGPVDLGREIRDMRSALEQRVGDLRKMYEKAEAQVAAARAACERIASGRDYDAEVVVRGVLRAMDEAAK